MLQKRQTGKYLFVVIGLLCSFYLTAKTNTPGPRLPASSTPLRTWSMENCWQPAAWKGPWAPNGSARAVAHQKIQVGRSAGAKQLDDITLTYQNFYYASNLFHFTFRDASWSQWHFSTTQYNATGTLGTLPAGIYDVEIYAPDFGGMAWYYIGCNNSEYAPGIHYMYGVEMVEGCNTVVIGL